MEIKEVKEESFESINGYLEKILPITRNIQDPCFVNYNGKKYLVTYFLDMTILVTEENGALRRFYLGTGKATDESPYIYEYYDDEKYLYEMLSNEVNEVNKTNKETKDQFRLTYLLPVPEQPNKIIQFVQYIDSIDASLEFNWNVTQIEDLASALAYTLYHCPERFVLQVIKYGLFATYKKEYEYVLNSELEGPDKYYAPQIKIGPLLLGHKKIGYDAQPFIEEICKRGFSRKVPKDMLSLISGKNEKFNQLKLISKEYRNYIKGK